MMEKGLKELRLNKFVEIWEIVEMLREAGGDVTDSTISSLQTKVKKKSAGYSPKLVAIKIGRDPHSVWLVTRESAEAWVAWKVGSRVRPRKK